MNLGNIFMICLDKTTILMLVEYCIYQHTNQCSLQSEHVLTFKFQYVFKFDYISQKCLSSNNILVQKLQIFCSEKFDLYAGKYNSEIGKALDYMEGGIQLRPFRIYCKNTPESILILSHFRRRKPYIGAKYWIDTLNRYMGLFQELIYH